MPECPLSVARSAGETRYFTGKPCRNGHTAERLVSSRACVVCVNLRRKAQHATPRGKAKVNARSATWQIANAERYRARLKRWRSENAERRRVSMSKWRAQNSRPNWRINLRQRIPAWSDRATIRAFYAQRPTGMEVDHVVPLNGSTVCGLHVLENLQYLTPAENRSKGNRWPVGSSDGLDDPRLFLCKPFHAIVATTPKE